MKNAWEVRSLSGVIAHTAACVLVATSLAACATTPAERAKETEIVRIELDRKLRPLRGERADGALVAGDLKVGVDGNRLNYKASYAIEPGDILAAKSGAPASPTRFGGQRIDQNFNLRLAELAGSPLSLGLASEFGDNWLVSGYSQYQRERANLNWSSGLASVNVEWAGGGLPFDGSGALRCDVRSTLRLPTHQGSDHSEALRLSAGDCSVAADNSAFSGLETQTFGLGYVWSRPRRQSAAEISLIDPAWEQVEAYRPLEPGYELGLSHRRDFGSLSAKTAVSFRQAPVLAGTAPDAAELYAPGASWATHTSLTWNLPVASVSANWATGVDRLWFTPDVGPRSDRFGLGLNLSRWFGRTVDGTSPKLAMNWNWSEVRLPGDVITGNNSLSLDMALMF